MASKDVYSGCFDIFFDEDSDCMGCEDRGSEGDLDAASTDDEIADGETSLLTEELVVTLAEP